MAGDQITERESQSATLINDQIYIFAGQGKPINEQDIFYNDLYRLKVDISEERQPSAEIQLVKPKLQPVPSERASQSACSYKDRYLIIVGGEGYPSKEERAEQEKQKE